ncbi:MAG: hypothetical protein WBD28_07640, partial [Candidatus Zixiibacteriota bacterium]
MSQPSYSNLISRLSYLRDYYTRNQLLYGILMVMAGILVLGLLGLLMGSLFSLPTVVRIIYLGILFLTLSLG